MPIPSSSLPPQPPIHMGHPFHHNHNHNHIRHPSAPIYMGHPPQQPQHNHHPANHHYNPNPNQHHINRSMPHGPHNPHTLYPGNPNVPNVAIVPITKMQGHTSSSSNNNNGHVPGSGIDTIEENQYAAVDFRELEEGTDNINDIDSLTTNMKMKNGLPRNKPPLNRSASADEYKKNQSKIKSHSFNKSTSNPIHKTQVTQSKLEDILKIASILKDIISHDIKTGAQIIEILSTKDTSSNKDDINDAKYEQICQLLISQNFINTDDKSHSFSLLKSYKFNHTRYDSIISQSQSHKPNLQSQSLSNIKISHPPSIHINSEYKYCGGTQVKVFSPKSNKIRPGLILSYDENTKKARICCYDSMGKQSMKTLPLPHPCVKPHYPTPQQQLQQQPPQPPLSLSPHYQSQPQPQPQPVVNSHPSAPQQHFPMTVDSWNYYVRDNNRN
eukprot:507138_1